MRRRPDIDDLDLDMFLFVSNLFKSPNEALAPSCGRGFGFGGGIRNLVSAGVPGFSGGGALLTDLATVLMSFVPWSVGAAGAGAGAGTDVVVVVIVVVVVGVGGVVGRGVGVARKKGNMALARADLHSLDTYLRALLKARESRSITPHHKYCTSSSDQCFA